MNEYGKIKCAFWQRGTGKRLRGDIEAQLVALYLMTCPARSMIGIFHVELPTIEHHTGLSPEGVRKGLERLSQEDFAHYDEADELVFVTNMAREQIGESITPTDNRHAGTLKLLEGVKRHRFYQDFLRIYGDALRLYEPSIFKGKPTNREVPTKPPRSQKQKQKQKHLSESEESEPRAPAVPPATFAEQLEHEHPGIDGGLIAERVAERLHEVTGKRWPSDGHAQPLVWIAQQPLAEFDLALAALAADPWVKANAGQVTPKHIKTQWPKYSDGPRAPSGSVPATKAFPLPTREDHAKQENPEWVK